MHVVIAGGGTGGHLYPCLALAETWVQRFPKTEILFIGTRAGIEARVVPQRGFRLETIWARGFVGKSFPQKIASLLCMFMGLLQSLVHLKRFAPSLVISIGGYIAGPVVMAAGLLRIKRVLLEPNVVPGAMNALLAPFAHLTVTAFEETGKRLRTRAVACLGVPVRSDVLAVAQRLAGQRPAAQSATETGKTVLVIGGSQGSHVINRGMIEALPFLAKTGIRIIHQTGERDFMEVERAYASHAIKAQVMKFIEKIADIYAVCDLVIARAGAGTLSELAVVGLPALLIPFPHAQGHQEKNARPFVTACAAEMILESEWAAQSGQGRAERILNLISDSKKLSEMSKAALRLGHPNAALDIMARCFELTGERFS